jgi:putative nucleotidyltransferase with HDIG domain
MSDWERGDALREKIFTRLEAIEDLPSLPIVITKLSEAIQNVDSSAHDVAKIMETDPSIMARVLKIVNSAFYSRGENTEKITDIRHAIVRLGYDAVRNIALTSSVFSIFKEDHAQIFDRKKFWQHCICTGITANVLREHIQGGESIPKESVALAGLLHDMGKIILEQYFYDLFTEMLNESQERDEDLYEVEKNVFKITHAEIGAWLGREWKLGQDFVEVIAHHHEPDEASEALKPLVSLVHVADVICHEQGYGQSGRRVPPPYKKEVWESLGLSKDSMGDILKVIAEETQKSEILLSLN